VEDCKCDLGYTGANGGECVACIAGTFKSIIGPEVCVSCAAGSYSERFAASSDLLCIRCEAGKYSTVVGASTMDLCLECPAGKFSTSIGASTKAFCQDCVAGKFSNATGARDPEVCRVCPPGTFSASPGAASQCTHVCDANYYSSINRSTCIPCPTHAISAPASGSRLDCSCLQGFSGPDGGACLACAAGTFKATNGSAPCTSCPPGKFQSEAAATSADACLSCPTNTFSAKDNTRCLDCPANSASPEGAAACECDPLYRGDDCDIKLPAPPSGTGRPILVKFTMTVQVNQSARGLQVGLRPLSAFLQETRTQIAEFFSLSLDKVQIQSPDIAEIRRRAEPSAALPAAGGLPYSLHLTTYTRISKG